MSLDAYVKPIMSPSFHWITFLTISNPTCSRTELIGLSKLVNLGALTIGKSVTNGSFDDSILRAWGRAVAEVGAFSMFRVLTILAQKDITPRIFTYLNQFPTLALFNTEDCSLGPHNKAEALALGWKYRTGKDLTDFLIQGGLANASLDSTMRACFRQAGVLSTDYLGCEGVEAIDSLPVLHSCLGLSPKDVALETTTNQRTRCFQRLSRKPLQNQTPAGKRPLIDKSQPHDRPVKRPLIRTSKQKDFSDLLMDFGS